MQAVYPNPRPLVRDLSNLRACLLALWPTRKQTEAKEKLEGIRNGTKELTKELKQLEAAYNQNGKDYEVSPCVCVQARSRPPPRYTHALGC